MPAALALSSLSCAADLLGIEARITVKALLPGGHPLAGAGVVVAPGSDGDAADPPVSVLPVAPAAGAGAGVVLEVVGAGVAVDAVGALSAGALCGGAAAAGAAAGVFFAVLVAAARAAAPPVSAVRKATPTIAAGTGPPGGGPGAARHGGP